MYLWVTGRAEKEVTFSNNIFQTKKTSVLGQNKAFFHHLRQQKKGG
jgi:hypothetical protein